MTLNYATDIAPIESGKTDAEIAEAISAARLADPNNYKLNTFITARTVYAILGPTLGETCLSALETAAGSNAVLARVVVWLKPGEQGIDVGIADTQVMLESLSEDNGGPLSALCVAKLRDHGLINKTVTEQDVADAKAAHEQAEKLAAFESAVIASRNSFDAGETVAEQEAAFVAARVE